MTIEIPDGVDAKLYRECIANGCSPRTAEMLASHSAPSLQTDSTFMVGQWNQFGENQNMMNCGRTLAEECRKRGGDPNGKVYLGQLADYPGDPQAWVESRADIKRVCRKKGLGCEGAVTVKCPTELRPKPKMKKFTDCIPKHA